MDLPSPLDTLSPEEQRIVRENLSPVTFTAGQCIFRAGDAGDGCYLIESGEVRLELVREHVDTDSVLGFIGLGSILGELALLDGLPRSVTAYAETPVVATHLPAGAIAAICHRHPVIGTSVVRALARDAAKKLRHMNERLAEYIAVDNSDDEIDETVKRAEIAQEQLAGWSEQQVDALLEIVAKAVAANAEPLAAATVSETRLGNVADKTVKNLHASLGVFEFSRREGRGGNCRCRSIKAGDADCRSGRDRFRPRPGDQSGGDHYLQGADRDQSAMRANP